MNSTIAGKEPPCRHCRTNVPSWPRVLCGRCYADPEVRPLYPPADPDRAGRLDTNRRPRPPAHPTDARPGSREKIRGMRARVARGEAVFHPADA